MRFTVSLDNSFNQWLVGDTPDVSGIIYANGRAASTLLGVNVSVNQARGVLFSERAATLDTTVTGRFSLVFPFELTTTTSGRIFVTALPDAEKPATISSTIGAGDSSVVVSISDAPTRGWCLIDGEWIEYTASGSTITFVTRGLFGTTAASHTSGATINFAAVKETCTPWYQYETRNRLNL